MSGLMRENFYYLPGGLEIGIVETVSGRLLLPRLWVHLNRLGGQRVLHLMGRGRQPPMRDLLARIRGGRVLIVNGVDPLSQ